MHDHLARLTVYVLGFLYLRDKRSVFWAGFAAVAALECWHLFQPMVAGGVR